MPPTATHGREVPDAEELCRLPLHAAAHNSKLSRIQLPSAGWPSTELSQPSMPYLRQMAGPC